MDKVSPEPPLLGHVLQPHPAQNPKTGSGLSCITPTHLQHVGDCGTWAGPVCVLPVSTVSFTSLSARVCVLAPGCYPMLPTVVTGSWIPDSPTPNFPVFVSLLLLLPVLFSLLAFSIMIRFLFRLSTFFLLLIIFPTSVLQDTLLITRPSRLH